MNVKGLLISGTVLCSLVSVGIFSYVEQKDSKSDASQDKAEVGKN